MIYFTADLHLGHNAIIYMKDRPFDNVYQMNETLIKNINSFVSNNDSLYILGDLCHDLTVEQANELIKKIRGRKYLIKGNHDKKYDESLFEGIYDYLELNISEVDFILMHYPLRSWNKMARGAIQLHGHIHAEESYNLNNKDKGIYQYDVGVDANNYFPVSAYQLIDYCKDVPINKNNHHNTDDQL